MKRWLARLCLAIAVPCALLLVAEAALRVAGYGHPSGFVIKDTVAGKPIWRDNLDYCIPFHGAARARAPEPFVVARPKGNDVYRIVVVGGSAAMGDPYPSMGLSRMLETLLAHSYDDLRVEVINAAMTAINSHVVHDVTRSCLDLQPDCIVVLVGNNEVIGPYGPGTVFAPSVGRLWWIRLSIRARQTRLGQRIAAAADQMRNSGPELEDPWKGMEMFVDREVRDSDHRLEAVYRHLAANLADVVSLGRAAGAAVVVCTVPVNLADCSPFSDPDGRAAEAFNAGHERLLAGKPAAAHEQFEHARDLDALRFRADSTINRAIREAVSSNPDPLVSLVEAEARFSESAGGAPGADLFVDHVHFTFDGNHLLASAVAQALGPLLKIQRPAATPTAVIPLPADAAAALVHTAWDEKCIADLMFERMLRPPFVSQADHAERIRALGRQKLGLSSTVAEDYLNRAIGWLHSGIESRPGDWVLLHKAARVLRDADQPSAAAEYYRRALAIVPHSVQLRSDLAATLALAGSSIEAVTQLRRSNPRLYDSDSIAHEALGATLLKDGQLERAAQLLERALAADPTRVSAHNNYGLLLLAIGRPDEAEVHFRSVVAEAPEYGHAHANLGLCLARQGRHDAALHHLSRAAELSPCDGDTHGNLGLLLTELGRTGEALEHLARAVELRPDAMATLNNLGYALAIAGRPSEAVDAYRDALAIEPAHARIEINLADALYAANRTDEALTAGRQALAHAMEQNETGLAETIGKRIAVFESADVP